MSGRHAQARPVTRRAIRRRARIHLIITAGMLAGILAAGGQAIGCYADNTTGAADGTGTHATVRAFTPDSGLDTGTFAASRNSSREALADDGWETGDSTSLTSDNITLIAAQNPTVRDLINGRDLGHTPDGFNPDHETGDAGSNTYPYGQCTWWAYQRRTQLNLPVSNRFGDARNWAVNAANLGYWTDSTPLEGDIVVFQPGQAGADAIYGHVAIVEHVSEDGTITISESNVNGQVGPFQRDIPADTAKTLTYIHY